VLNLWFERSEVDVIGCQKAPANGEYRLHTASERADSRHTWHSAVGRRSDGRFHVGTWLATCLLALRYKTIILLFAVKEILDN